LTCWLEALGWHVQVLEGLDHTQAMRAAHVLPILCPWLIGRLGRCSARRFMTGPARLTCTSPQRSP
jgi:hypothetical protein